MDCFCIKRTMTLKVLIGPATLCLISLGSAKQEYLSLYFVEIRIMPKIFSPSWIAG